MQKLAVAPLLLVSLALAGCSASNSPGNASASTSAAPVESSAVAAPITATAVTGTVTLDTQGVVIQPDAKLTLTLVDVTQQPNLTINAQVIPAPTFPAAINVPFQASAINPSDLYNIQAVMQNGDRTWTTKLQQPVLTRNQPADVKLVLSVEPTAADKLLAAFAKAKAQTGGMKVKQGTASKIGQARSWQVFSDARGVEFIIEQVNVADKGFTKTEYSYSNGMPWVVVRETMAQQGGPVTSTEKVGWDENGVVVLNQLISGGKTMTISADDATALHHEAEAQHKQYTP